MHKKVFLSAKKDTFWLDVVRIMESSGYNVCYWVGAEATKEKISDCFFHEVVDAYELKNCYEVTRCVFNIRWIDFEEYYNYLKILDRADNLGGYSFSQRDRLFREQLSYWYSVCKVLDPDLIVFSNLPHLLYDYPLYLVAKTLKIKTLIFNVTPFRGWHFVTENLSSKTRSNLVWVNDEHEDVSENFHGVAIQPYSEKKYSLPSYMLKQVEFDKKNSALRTLKSFVKYVLDKFGIRKKPQLMRGSWQHSFLQFIGWRGFFSKITFWIFRKTFKTKLRKAYTRNTLDSYKLKKIKSFVYVPLHYQPEATTAPLGGVYSDQIYMIEALREAFPPEVSIVVKEHYSQFSEALSGFRGRYLDYWDRINRIENVVIAPLETDPEWLILESLAVATVTGTAGWEAIQYGKGCIVFGEPWYVSHPNVVRFDENFTFEFNKTLNKDKVETANEDFISNFSKALLKVDIHGYTERAVSRDPNVVFKAICKFIQDKERAHV